MIKEAVSFGDLKENAAYHDAKEREMFLRMKILELEEKVLHAEVVPTNTFIISINNKEQKITIGKDASPESPIARAISGKKEGETAEFEVNGRKNKIKIIKILK